MELATYAPPSPAVEPPARPRREGRVTLGLLALSTIPTLAGIDRLSLLARGLTPQPDDVRIATHPTALAVHVVCATLYCVLGALQFWPALLRRRPWLHRALGWWLAPLGVAGTLAGMWLAVRTPPQPGGSAALTAMRLIVGGGMLASLAGGVIAATRRAWGAHRAWMVRAYALGSAAGTQALVLAPLVLLGAPLRLRTTLGMAAGWLIHAVTAEVLLRRREPTTRSPQKEPRMPDRGPAPTARRDPARRRATGLEEV
ncbi:MAG: DUF2306 domain-containing protein [Polyangiales bacterium]